MKDAATRILITGALMNLQSQGLGNTSRKQLSTLLSFFGAVGGALTFLELLTDLADLVELKTRLRPALDAWSAVVSPVANFLFGWVRDFTPWELPSWAEDYLTLGVLVGLGFFRAWLFAVPSGTKRPPPNLTSLRNDVDQAQQALPKPGLFFNHKLLDENLISILRSIARSLDDYGSIIELNDAERSKYKGLVKTAVRDKMGDVRQLQKVLSKIKDSCVERPAEKFTARWLAFYWLVFPLWPLAISLASLRAVSSASISNSDYFMHLFGFLIIAVALVFISYGLFWLP